MKLPTATQREIHRRVCGGAKIADVAKEAGMSKSSVRYALDRVTEFDCKQFDLTLSGDEVAQVIGWLRNGNTTSAALADKIIKSLDGI